MSKIMECQNKECKFSWMAKRADYCPRCKGMEIEPKAQKQVGVREDRGAGDSAATERTPGDVPSKDES